MSENAKGVESVRVAFELLQEELGDAVSSARDEAAKAVKAGAYEQGAKSVESARGVEDILTKLTELHDQWAEISDYHDYDAEGAESEYGGPMLVMTHKNASATAKYNNGWVVVLAGSTIASETFPSLPDRYKDLRKSLIEKGKLKNGGNDALMLSEDIRFNSPSGAAQFVAGSSVSGNRDWRVEDTDQSLGFWLKKARKKVG